MKKICFFVILLLLSSLFLSSLSLSLYASPSQKSLLVIGDSISTGYGLEGYPDGNDIKNYGNLFAEKLGCKKDQNFFNLSIDGETTSGLLWRIQNSDDDRFSGFDTVLISSGGNDLLDSLLPSMISLISELSSDSYNTISFLPKISLAADRFISATRDIGNKLGENLDLILKDIKEKNPNAFIAILGIYDPFDDSSNPAAIKYLNRFIIEPCISIINEAIKNSAEKNGVYFIDIADSFQGRGKELTNISKYDIHPNTEGHKLISELISNKFDRHQSAESFMFIEAEDNIMSTVLVSSLTTSGIALFCRFYKRKQNY